MATCAVAYRGGTCAVDETFSLTIDLPIFMSGQPRLGGRQLQVATRMAARVAACVAVLRAVRRNF
jgi:hypothetical protein